MKLSRTLLALLASLLALSVVTATAEARPKPNHLSGVQLDEQTTSRISGYTVGLGPCNITRPVVLLGERNGDEGRMRVIARAVSNRAGGFAFNRELSTAFAYQVVAPKVERRRFICRSASSELFAFFE